MSKKLIKISVAATLSLAALGLSCQQVSAQVIGAPAVVVGSTGGASSAVAPIVLGGAVLSIMIRAAYVHSTECRELTTEEALTGVLPIWGVYHKTNNKCGGSQGDGGPRNPPCGPRQGPVGGGNSDCPPPPRGECRRTTPPPVQSGPVRQDPPPPPRGKRCPSGYVFVAAIFPAPKPLVVKY